MLRSAQEHIFSGGKNDFAKGEEKLVNIHPSINIYTRVQEEKGGRGRSPTTSWRR
jgi:hypothetical protein